MDLLSQEDDLPRPTREQLAGLRSMAHVDPNDPVIQSVTADEAMKWFRLAVAELEAAQSALRNAVSVVEMVSRDSRR